MDEFAFSPTPPLPAAALPRYPWYHWRRLGFNFLTISIAAHLFFGVGATYLIVQTIQAKRKQTFAGPPSSPNAPTRALEHKVQMQKKQATMSAPAPVKRITTTSNTKVALPAMPAMPKLDSQVVPLAMAGMGGTGMGLGMGSGGGGGGGGNGGGLSLFGFHSNTGNGVLTGTFYDLKQTRDRQPVPDMAASIDGDGMHIDSPANAAYAKTVGGFIRGGFNEESLSRFFRGPNSLATKQIFIPTMSADHGPEGFGLQGQVAPKRWLVVYRGNVTPPVDGSYRFVGVCDDILAVRFNNRVVLDGSLHNPSGYRPRTEYKYGGTNYSFYASDPNNASAGTSYPLEVCIGEQPGGVFCAFLMIEKVGEKYDKSPSGAPILPVFKFGVGATPHGDGSAPEIAADTAWSVWKTTAASAGNTPFSVFSH